MKVKVQQISFIQLSRELALLSYLQVFSEDVIDFHVFHSLWYSLCVPEQHTHINGVFEM